MKLKYTFILLIILLIGKPTYAQDIDTNKINKINKFIDYIEQKNQDVGAISLFKDGKEVYSRYFGQQNIPGLKFNKNTKFHIGSISKLFTATLIWRLIEQGNLALTDKLSEFFPDMPNAQKIDIKNLLEHSSGLGDYVIKQDTLYYWLRHPQSEKNILKEIKRQGVLFQPGDSVSYSNSGYYLLARIVEKKYNHSYSEVLKKQITDPLKLKNTLSSQDNPQNVFHSYSYTNGRWNLINEFDFNNAIGVGGIVSTPKDLNKFINALFNGRILKKATVEKMKPIVGKEIFGRGLMLAPFNQHIAFGHGGDTYGTHSVVSYNPQNGLSMAYIINGERFLTNNFAIDILNIIYGYDFEYPQFHNYLKTDTKELKKYIGTYSSSELPISLTIFIKDSILTAQGSGQPSFPLYKYDSNKFEYEKAGVKIDFKPKENQLILKQHGSEYIMTKRKDE